MKNLAKSALVFAFLSLIFSSAPARDVDAVYKNITEEYVLNEDGTWAYVYSHRLEYVSYYSINRYLGETFVVWDPERQEFELLENKTTHADGSVFEATPNARNDVLPRCAAHATPYMNLRETVLTHIGLEPNCFVDLKYKIKTKESFVPGIDEKIVLAGRDPIESRKVVVKIPQDFVLRYRLSNSDVKPNVADEAGFTVHEWNFDGFEAIPNEPGSPDLDEIAPTLTFSTIESVDVLAAKFYDKNLYKLDEAATEAFREAASEGVDDISKIAAIEEFVKDGIALCGCYSQETDYRPQSAQNTFDAAVGTETDKSVLLAAGLRAAGFDDARVVFEADDFSDFLSDYDETRVRVETAYGEFFLSPTEDLTLDELTLKPRESSIGGDPLFFAKKEGEACYECDFSEITLKIKIKSPDEFCGEGVCRLAGCAAYRDDDLNESVIRKALGIYSDEIEFSSPKLIGVRPGYETGVSFKGGELEKITDGLYRLAPPKAPSRSEGFAPPISQNPRMTPLELAERPFAENSTTIISFPKNLMPVGIPDNWSVESKVADLTVSFELREGEIISKRSAKIKLEQVAPEQYEELKEIYRVWTEDKHNAIYFEVKR